MRRKVALVVPILLATITSAAVAQITTATISGTIKDETGGVLPGVDIVVTNLDTGLTRSTVSDAQGYFAVPGLGRPTRTTQTRIGQHRSSMSAMFSPQTRRGGYPRGEITRCSADGR